MEEVGTVRGRDPSPEGRCLPCEETCASGHIHERRVCTWFCMHMYLRVYLPGANETDLERRSPKRKQ